MVLRIFVIMSLILGIGSKEVAHAKSSEFIALSRQNALFREMEVLANNVANLSTPGYQEEQVIYNVFKAPGGVAYTQDVGVVRNHAQGQLSVTHSPFDLAIAGRGFFVIESSQGVKYTRQGSFRLDNNFNVVTQQGHKVVSSSGQPISVPQGYKNFHVTNDGIIIVDEEQIAELAIVEFEDEGVMHKHGANLYSTNEEGLPAMNAVIYQGMVESSNVSAVKSLTKMMHTSRGVSNTSSLLRSIHDMELVAIRELTKTN